MQADGESIQTLDINLEVSPMEIPPPEQWAFHLDLWQNPFAVARYHDVPLWSEEHWKYLKPLLEMLAGAGQKSITVSVLDSPWGGQTYDPFKAMVKWTRHKDGGWSYDYSVFDRWVSFAREAGIKEQINVYTMIPWGNEFRYFDEEEDAYVTKKLEPGTKEYNAHWRPFLEDFAKHLKEKGWFDRTNIAMDERPMEAMKGALDLIRQVEPNFKVALAGNYHKEIASDIYDLSVTLSQNIPDQVIQRRNKVNKITTFYTSCAHEKPNTFTFSKPAYATWYAWYAAAHNLSGYLRWAYNSWVRDPLKDSRFRTWPAGDTYLVYPGARSSIRFERLREGIQDFEKIRILKEKIRRQNTPESKQQLQRLQDILDSFRVDQLEQQEAGQMIREGRKVLKTIEKQITN